MERLSFIVFGAEEKCASCVNLPSSKETLEWLEAAVTRKFPDVKAEFHYVDINTQEVDELHANLVEKTRDRDYFYPLVLMNGEIVAEGNPVLKDIFARVERWSKDKFI